MNYVFRLPKFPVILDAGSELIHAKTKGELSKRVSKIVFADEDARQIIDATADGFSLYPKTMIVAPSIAKRRWTKSQIIELYNSKRRPGAPELLATSLGNRSLERRS
jgi:hypothetical protein